MAARTLRIGIAIAHLECGSKHKTDTSTGLIPGDGIGKEVIPVRASSFAETPPPADELHLMKGSKLGWKTNSRGFTRITEAQI